MAITLVRKNEKEVFTNLLFDSSYDEEDEDGEHLTVIVSVVDDNLKATHAPEKSSVYKIADMSEEDFHTDLRKESAQKGQLVTSHCTDPAWNPEGYTKSMEDEFL